MESIKVYILVCVWFGVLGLIFIIGVLPTQESKQRANGYKLDNCIKIANEIGFNPNDEERHQYIINCFNK